MSGNASGTSLVVVEYRRYVELPLVCDTDHRHDFPEPPIAVLRVAIRDARAPDRARARSLCLCDLALAHGPELTSHRGELTPKSRVESASWWRKCSRFHVRTHADRMLMWWTAKWIVSLAAIRLLRLMNGSQNVPTARRRERRDGRRASGDAAAS